MRADDDAYVKTEQLEKFLRTLNSSQPIFLGQTGLGNAEVRLYLFKALGIKNIELLRFMKHELGISLVTVVSCLIHLGTFLFGNLYPWAGLSLIVTVVHFHWKGTKS